MARSLKATLTATMVGTLTNASTTAADNFTHTASATFGNGVGANAAQRYWSSTGRTLTAAQAEDIDMYDMGSIDVGAGAGLDSLGQALALTGIKGLYVKNHSDSAGALLVGNKNATTCWNTLFNGSDTAEIILAPGASFIFSDPTAAGLAVADTTNHLLTMTDAGSGCTYDVAFIGI